jgi:hypothetical protein
MSKVKTLAVIRTCAVREASKTSKSDNKPITGVFALCFFSVAIANRSALELALHPAGLEPATL